MENNIPEKFQEYLGEYGIVEIDAKAKQPVGWGHPLVGKMGEELFEELKQYGTMVYNPKTASWGLVTKQLTDDEAIQQYGPITNVEHGPRGGFKSITFGNTTFTSKLFKR